MSLGKAIAKLVAPEEVQLTTEFVQRLRASHDELKRRNEYLERDNKRLLKQVMKLKDKLREPR